MFRLVARPSRPSFLVLEAASKPGWRRPPFWTPRRSFSRRRGFPSDALSWQRPAGRPYAHLTQAYPQHPVFATAGAAGIGAEPQPHPAPPVDFTSASRAQHAFVPAGAGPPQHVPGAACCWVVDAGRSGALGVVVCVRVASAMSISCEWRRSQSSRSTSEDALDLLRTQ
jgi:hypothetical protein